MIWSLLPEAEQWGTEYIQTKGRLSASPDGPIPLREKIVGHFSPHLFFSGRIDGGGLWPTSYLTTGPEAHFCSGLWLARFLRLDASYHFIHGAGRGQRPAVICSQTSPSARDRSTGGGMKPACAGSSVPFTVNGTMAPTLPLPPHGPHPPGVALHHWLMEALVVFVPHPVEPVGPLYPAAASLYSSPPSTRPEKFSVWASRFSRSGGRCCPAAGGPLGGGRPAGC